MGEKSLSIFFAQVVYVHVHHVGARVKREVPDFAHDFVAAEGPALIEHEVLQQCQLPHREVDALVAAPYELAAAIQFQVGYFQHVFFYRHGIAPVQGAQPGQQLVKLEGLHQVVVGAGVEAHELVVGGGHGREHEHGQLLVALPDVAAQLVAAHFGQVHVQNHGRVLRRGQQALGRSGIQRHGGGHAVVFQPTLQERSYFQLVFNNQDFHGSWG